MRLRNLLASIVFALTLLLATGCAQDPATRAYQFHQGYTATLTAIDQAAQAGKLNPAQARLILKLRPLADVAERQVDALATTGGPSFDAALNAAQDILNQLIAAQLAKPTATTQGSK